MENRDAAHIPPQETPPWQGDLPGKETPQQGDPPSRETPGKEAPLARRPPLSMCGRYASYWNAFWFTFMLFPRVISIVYFSVNPADTTFPANLLPPVPLVSTRTKEVHRSIEHL